MLNPDNPKPLFQLFYNGSVGLQIHCSIKMYTLQNLIFENVYLIEGIFYPNRKKPSCLIGWCLQIIITLHFVPTATNCSKCLMYIISDLHLPSHSEVTIITLILQMRKWVFRKVNCLAQGHMRNEGQGLHWNQGLLDFGAWILFSASWSCSFQKAGQVTGSFQLLFDNPKATPTFFFLVIFQQRNSKVFYEI